MRRRTGIAGIVALSVTACAGGAEPTANSNDIDQAPQLGLVEELRLGSFDDPEQGFSRVSGVDVDRDGNLYVYEGSEAAIRVYSSEGSLLRRIGGQGEGPGEFVGGLFSFLTFGVTGDTVWAIDGNQSRITLFSRQGDLLSADRFEEARLQVKNGWVSVRPTILRQNGTFLGWPNSIRFPRDDDPVTATDNEVPIPRLVFGTDGTIRDTIGWTHRPPPRLVPPADYESSYRSIEVGGVRYSVPSPPSRLPNWYARPDGYLSVSIPHPDPEQGRFQLARMDLQGDTVALHEFVYRPRPYTDAVLEAIALEEASGGNNMAFVGGEQIRREQAPAQLGEITARLVSEMRFPSHQPGVTLPKIMNDGSAWFPRSHSESDSEKRWIVIDTRGMVQGEVRLPANARPLWSDGETAWVSEPDDFDVPWLVRYRIQGDDQGL